MTKKRIFFGALIFLQFNKTVILIRRISMQQESRVVDVKIFFRNLIVYIAQNALFGGLSLKNIVENLKKLLYNITIYSKEVNYEDF